MRAPASLATAFRARASLASGALASRAHASRALAFGLACAAALACEPRKVVDHPPKPACKPVSAVVAGVPEVTSLAFDPRVPGVIFAGAVDGLYVSSDCGATFAKADGPRGVVTAVAPGSVEGTALAASGGLWTLTAPDGGASDDAQAAARLSQWARVASSAPIDDDVTIVSDGVTVSVASSAGFATFDDDGWQLVTRASDGGAACVALKADGALARCSGAQTRVAPAPSDASVIYAVVPSPSGALSAAIARSVDGGATFAGAVDVDPVSRAPVSGLAVDVGDPQIVYVTTTSPAAIYSSDDGGATFVQRKAFTEAIGGTNGSVVVAADTGSAIVRAGHSLFITHDAGVDWTEQPAAAEPAAGVVDTALGHVAVNIATGVVVDDTAIDLGDRAVAITHDSGDFFVVTRSQVWRVALDGSAHVELGQLPRGNITAVAASPADDVLRVATAEAVLASRDDGATFTAVVVDDPGFPGGSLAASAVGVLSANGGSHSFFMKADDVKTVGAGAVFSAAASSPTSRTAWLAGASALLLSLDGGDTFGDPIAAPAGAVFSTAALDGDALALAVANDDGSSTLVDVDNDGAALIRAQLPCTPRAVASSGQGAVIVGGGDCGLVILATAGDDRSARAERRRARTWSR
jgi:hypothetical protein